MTETAKLEALERCPFCGSHNIDPLGWASTDSAGPACDDCGASAGKATQTVEQNVSTWNTRAPFAWRPIATADKSIAVDMQFPNAPRMLHSYPIWVRADGGKPFEASWVQRKPNSPEGYWWDWDAEDVADPDEWMAHPLAVSSEGGMKNG